MNESSHTNESCHIWMRHVAHEWVMSHINESCHIQRSHVKYEWVMSHINESCHIQTSHVTYEWVMSHMNESCHTQMSPVTYDESWTMRERACASTYEHMYWKYNAHLRVVGATKREKLFETKPVCVFALVVRVCDSFDCSRFCNSCKYYRFCDLCSYTFHYGVATISRLLKIKGLFC